MPAANEQWLVEVAGAADFLPALDRARNPWPRTATPGEEVSALSTTSSDGLGLGPGAKLLKHLIAFRSGFWRGTLSLQCLR